MEFKLYFRMLQRGWWVIVLVALIAVVVSLSLSYIATPQYQAIARFIVTPGSNLDPGPDVVASLNTLDRRSIVATYAEVMNSNRILALSGEAMKLPEALSQEYAVLAVVLPDANVLELTVTGADPKIVTELANTIGYQTILFSRGLNMSYELNFLDSAVLPLEPISPQPLRDAGLALLLGIVAGAALTIVNEQVRIPLEAYKQKTRVDSVTGVYNSRYFNQVLEDELAKDPDGMLSVGIVKLSGLEDLLETLPLSGLQLLLQKVTGILRKELRGNDIIGRWSDISFILMLPTTPSIAAKRTLDRIYSALSQEVVLSAYDVAIKLEPHIGGAVFSNSISVQELLSKAEDSLSQAQISTENPVFLWDMNSPFWVQKDA